MTLRLLFSAKPRSERWLAPFLLTSVRNSHHWNVKRLDKICILKTTSEKAANHKK